MAINDELDSLLSDSRITDAEWGSLAEALKRKPEELPEGLEARRKFINEHLRYAYSHVLTAPFRGTHEPDYLVIVRDTARIVNLPVEDHHTVPELERQIIARVIDRFKGQIIKEKGQAEWDRIEREAREQVEAMVQRGEVPASYLKLLGPSTLIAAIVAGRLAGFGLYIFVNQLFFQICRSLGIKASVTVFGPIIGRSLSLFLGPLGWAIGGGWLLMDLYKLGDTNWGKVLPAVLMIACIRARLSERSPQPDGSG